MIGLKLAMLLGWIVAMGKLGTSSPVRLSMVWLGLAVALTLAFLVPNVAFPSRVWAEAANADLSITKTDSSDPVAPGGNLTYTVTVTNNGPSTATDVTLTDTLPGGVTFVSATPDQGSCSGAATVTCNLGTIISATSTAVTIAVTPTTAGTITNSASVTANETDLNTGNNSATQTTTVALGPDLSITMTDSADPVAAGENLTYTVAVTNNGPSTATDVTLTVTLPSGVTFVSATPDQGSCSGAATVTCNLGTIISATSTAVTITVTPTTAGTITNSASVTANETDPNTGNNSATQTTTVILVADLSITKTDSADPVAMGGNLTYTVTVTNNGPSTATDVTLTDTLPGGVTFASAIPSQGTCSGTATVTCALGSISSATSTAVTIAVTPTTVGTITNSAGVTANETDPNTGNNSATQTTTVILAADLSITKTDSADPVAVGGNLTYTVTMTNNGPSAATDVTLTDTLPGGVTFVSAMPSQGTCSGTATVTCALGTISSGASATVAIVVTPTTAGTITNSASVTANETDPDTANNFTTQTTVALAADISVTKTDSADPLAVGGNLTYTLAVTNNGPSTATDVTLTDTLPGGVTFISATLSQGTCSGTATVTCALGTISSGANTTVATVVTPTTAGTITNTAGVTANETDPDTANNAATQTTYVISPPAAGFTVEVTTGDAPLPVKFTDTSTGGPTSWLWNFGDGSTSTVQSPSHTYNRGGVFTVKLTATNADGVDTVAKTGLITVTGLVSRIAFSRSGPLYVVDADGSNLTRLANGTVYYPAWSPDGSKIAFSGYAGPPGVYGLYVIDADGSNPTLLLEHPSYPTWSPDSTRIAFTYLYDIYIMDADGSNLTRIVDQSGDDNYPDWSPDGNKIAFSKHQGIHVMDADGSNLTRVGTNSNYASAHHYPAWSPDGTRLAFNAHNSASGFDIFTMNADGSSVTNITNLPSSNYDIDPDWSPDGSKIVFSSERECNDCNRLYVMNADGSNQLRITNDTIREQYPTWSPAVFPQVPAGLAKTTSFTDSTPTFTWQATPSTQSYQVRLDQGVWTDAGNTTAYTVPDSGALAGGAHTVEVRAVAVTGFAGHAASLGFVLNHQPVANGQSVSTGEDTAVTITLSGSDGDGESLTFSIVGGPTHGTLGPVTSTGATTATVVYTPDAGFHGSDSFTHKANDGNDGGNAESNVATVSITVNDPPVANGADVSTNEDNAITITLTGSDPNGDFITFSIVSGPVHGSLGAVTSTGAVAATVVYTASSDFNGVDSFSYKTNDGTVDSDAVTISITVNPVNDRPTAIGQNVGTGEDTAVIVVLKGSDIDGDTLAFSTVTGPAHGALSEATSATSTPAALLYTPDASLRYLQKVCKQSGGVPSL